jgi:hypothetical protein
VEYPGTTVPRRSVSVTNGTATRLLQNGNTYWGLTGYKGSGAALALKRGRGLAPQSLAPRSLALSEPEAEAAVTEPAADLVYRCE